MTEVLFAPGAMRCEFDPLSFPETLPFPFRRTRRAPCTRCRLPCLEVTLRIYPCISFRSGPSDPNRSGS